MFDNLPPALQAALEAFGRRLVESWQIQQAPQVPQAPQAPTRTARTRRAPRAKAPAAPRRRSPTPAAHPGPAAGDIVRYQQGRGSFEARVVRMDRATKLFVLERLSDGKRVKRPAFKLYPAGKK